MTDAQATALAFDLKRLDPAFLDDPFPVYRALREHDPVHRMPDGSYFLSRYDDCAAGSASCRRPPSHPARSWRSSHGSRRSWITCSTAPTPAAAWT